MVPDEERLTRKLAAILMADVVGYSRLMGDDEAGTLARLKSHRHELIDPTISSYHGRIVKLMGDGALVEFPSVVDAVACALAIQEGMVERNREVSEEVSGLSRTSRAQSSFIQTMDGRMRGWPPRTGTPLL